ncbi:MAG: MerR family transcriptional regulator [Candidatus Methylomirabilales bacterium]
MTPNRLRPIDVARQLGRSASWLKALERAGIIPPAQRDELSGARFYVAEDVERIRQALLARKRNGVPTKELAGQVA